MQEIGKTLRQLREKKGLTLEQVEQAIKIRMRYLEAIEDGDMSVLPGMVYARGFIKSYAEYLGINGQELLDSHETSTPQAVESSQTSSIETLGRTERSRKITDRTPAVSMRLLPQFLAGAGVLAVVVLAYMFLISNTEDQQTQEPVQTQQTETAQEATITGEQQPAAPVQQPVEPAKPKTVVEQHQKGASQATFAVKSSEPMLTLVMGAPNGDCWIQVVADGKVIASETVKKGEQRTWKASKTLSLQTGNSKAITMQLNDEPVTFEPQLRAYTYSFLRDS